MTIPLDIGPLHFVGMGGIGMSGIAEMLHRLGYQVQGSDQSDNANVKRLRGLGITVHVGHDPAHVKDVAAVVISTAVKAGNPELDEAVRLGLPIVRRADMLAELARLKTAIAIAGTHGKTTTTSLVDAVLAAGGLSPSVVNGGVLAADGSNARLADGEHIVLEADESDGTFLRLPMRVGVVTNIDPEHLDFYGNFDAVRCAFRQFVENIPFYGFGVLCIDHPEVQRLMADAPARRLVTYGFSPQADYRALNVRYDQGYAVFDVAGRNGHQVKDIRLPLPGDHNVLNALAAFVVGAELGVTDDAAKQGLEDFKGVARRFTRMGEFDGAVVIDDYAHHPVEISAALEAARQAFSGKVIALAQPHRYSRLQSLFDDFAGAFGEADEVLVLPIFAAGEAPVKGFEAEDLARAIAARGHRAVSAPGFDDPEQLAGLLRGQVGPDDVIIGMGAGSITRIAASLPDFGLKVVTAAETNNASTEGNKTGGRK